MAATRPDARSGVADALAATRGVPRRLQGCGPLHQEASRRAGAIDRAAGVEDRELLIAVENSLKDAKLARLRAGRCKCHDLETGKPGVATSSGGAAWYTITFGDGTTASRRADQLEPLEGGPVEAAAAEPLPAAATPAPAAALDEPVAAPAPAVVESAPVAEEAAPPAPVAMEAEPAAPEAEEAAPAAAASPYMELFQAPALLPIAAAAEPVAMEGFEDAPAAPPSPPPPASAVAVGALTVTARDELCAGIPWLQQNDRLKQDVHDLYYGLMDMGSTEALELAKTTITKCRQARTALGLKDGTDPDFDMYKKLMNVKNQIDAHRARLAQADGATS